MNAVATSPATNGAHGSDSDNNSDDAAEYYQPISTIESGGGEGRGEEEEEEDFSDADLNPNFHRLPNGWLEDGLSSLDLSEEDEDEDEDDDGEEAWAIESEREIERAFREDERRRSAPLAVDTAVRIMEAMRGVSIAGVAPEWASEVAEEEWVDRLRRLRGQTSSDAGGMDH